MASWGACARLAILLSGGRPHDQCPVQALHLRGGLPNGSGVLYPECAAAKSVRALESRVVRAPIYGVRGGRDAPIAAFPCLSSVAGRMLEHEQPTQRCDCEIFVLSSVRPVGGRLRVRM